MIEQKIRETAKELLEKKTVDLVIGFRDWTLPLRTTPVFIRTPAGAETLTWNSFCENNLAVYLRKFSHLKVGMIVKGCDARSITALSLEKRMKPGQLFLVGVPCQRMVDRRKVQRAVKAEILQAREEAELLHVEGEGFEVSLKREDFLYTSCQTCLHRNPVKADVWVGDPVEEFPLTEVDAEVRAFEKMSSEERWGFFEKETARCIRCYACREVCPMCYCTECFVDSSNPKWIEKGLDPSDIQFYHTVRAYHQVGRCTGCGACERACPMNIRLTYLTQKLNLNVKELFGFETGVDSEQLPPLATYDIDDEQGFIK